jgi:hypothetical protein
MDQPGGVEQLTNPSTNSMNPIRYRFVLLLLMLVVTRYVTAQEDLLKMLEEETPEKASPVFATFKSTRVINLHSNETIKAKHLDFRIMHRFQPLDIGPDNVYGLYNFIGLDGATIRIGLEYGINDRVMVGIGRSTPGKLYDFMTKIKLLEQTRGKRSMPVSVNYFANTGISTTEWADKSRDNLFSSRLSFVHQLIIARKWNDYLSTVISPAVVHHNLVQTVAQPNDVYAVGIGASVKLNRSIRLSLEYIPRLNGQHEPKDASGTPLYNDAFAFGFDIETGGHVFQLHFTNAPGLTEQQFIAQNTGKLSYNALRFGFNLSRTFSFDKH